MGDERHTEMGGGSRDPSVRVMAALAERMAHSLTCEA